MVGKRWPGPKLGLSPAYGNYYGGERPNVDYDAKVSKSPIWVNRKIADNFRVYPCVSNLTLAYGEAQYLGGYHKFKNDRDRANLRTSPKFPR
jgi:hypothetical protein